PGDDLVFFLIDAVPRLDLSRIHAPYQDETRGAPPFDPAMMTCLLLDAYCVGVFSSRKIAQACERNLAFLAIVGTDRPDFRTISLFRKEHLDAFADVFVQVLRLAQAAGLVRLGTIAVDGTKVQGNASRHKAKAKKGWGYSGNAKASADGACQIILACDGTAQCNDKQQAEPMAAATRAGLDRAGIAPPADESGARPRIAAVLDTGYFSGPA